MMKKLLVVTACGALLGCQSVTDVVPVGKDSYMVGSSARGGFTSNTEVAGLSIRRANEFCNEQGKRMQINHNESFGIRGLTPQETQITFSCLNENDPAYQRSDLRSAVKLKE